MIIFALSCFKGRPPFFPITESCSLVNFFALALPPNDPSNTALLFLGFIVIIVPYPDAISSPCWTVPRFLILSVL